MAALQHIESAAKRNAGMAALQQIESAVEMTAELNSGKQIETAAEMTADEQFAGKAAEQRIVTAVDLGRMAADMLVKEAKLTIMSRTVPASESENAHKDIMENRGAVQNPHRYGRKPQQPKSDAE
jgi:hypothetical protein